MIDGVLVSMRLSTRLYFRITLSVRDSGDCMLWSPQGSIWITSISKKRELAVQPDGPRAPVVQRTYAARFSAPLTIVHYSRLRIID